MERSYSASTSIHFDQPSNNMLTGAADCFSESLICRGCLSMDRRMARGNFVELYTEFTQIAVENDSSWQLCCECAALLSRAARVRRRMTHAARCAQLPVKVWDKELLSLVAPSLSVAATLVFALDTQRDHSGFHSTLYHTSQDVASVFEASRKTEIKVEPDTSDIEDHLPLNEFKREFDVLNEQSAPPSGAASVAEADLKQEASEPDEPVRRKKKREKKKKKREKKRLKVKCAPSKVKEEDSTARARARKPVDVDPAKIRVLRLDPEEQMRAAASSPALLKFPFRCNLCHRGFNYEAKLENHMKKHDPARGKFECTICKMYLPSVYSHRVHMLIHTTRYQCLQCGKTMTDKGCIIEHYEAAHEGKIQQICCRICGKISSNDKTHRGHMRNRHGGDRPGCDQCGKTFVNKDSLAEHILIHLGVKNHKCVECARSFRTATQLTHHRLRHTDARDFYCVECDVRFKSAHNLAQHLAKSRRHLDLSSLRFQCPRCPRRLESERALEHHVSFGHEGRRLFGCSECGVRLATRASLMKHTRTSHQGYRAPLKHVCDSCGRAFRSKCVLVNHMRTHTGEKPFECGECGRKFSQRAAMKTHVKLVHLKVKRGTKLRDSELSAKPGAAAPAPAPAPAPAAPKQELLVVYDAWPRAGSGEMYFLPAESASLPD